MPTKMVTSGSDHVASGVGGFMSSSAGLCLIGKYDELFAAESDFYRLIKDFGS